MKQKVLQILLAVAALFMVYSCSSDNDEQPTDTATEPTIEVCIVFAPKDLGDQGYADRILTGMFMFDQQLSSKDYDRVLLRYITPSDDETLHEQLRQWDKQGISAYTRKPFERRLLVLTSASQLQYLADTPLGDTDEVLVLNVADSQLDQAPRKSWLGARLHSLSISAADAARKLCRHIDYQLSHPESFTRERAIPDSLYEVLHDHYGDDLRPVVMPRTTTGIDFDRAVEIIRSATSDGATTASTGSYCIYNCGNYNPYFYGYFYTHQTDLIETAFIDTGGVEKDRGFTSIVRYYERAFSEWLVRWLAAPSATMPAREWHGAWDGYTVDDIETYDN